MNQLKTVLLLGLLTGLLVALGGAIGGRGGMIIALVIAAAMNFFSYWYSDKIVLKMYRARPVSESEAPGVYGMVRELAQSAGLPTPRVYVVDDDTPNAFATGRNPENAVVAVTTGILSALSPRELRGVLGHELAHIKDRDILISSVAATLAGAIMVLANLARWSMIFGGSRDDKEGGGSGILGILAMSILAPIGAMLVQMAVSRSREYLADKEGAEMARDPEALASALTRMQEANQRQPMHDAKPQSAHMFIVNPLSGKSLAGLFSTHPPTEERVARLKEMAGQGGYTGYTPPANEQRHSTAPTPPPPPPSSSDRPGRGKIDWS